MKHELTFLKEKKTYRELKQERERKLKNMVWIAQNMKHPTIAKRTLTA